MNSPKSKVRVGIALLAFFAITLVTGLILHLKKHGVVIEPRAAIKIVHYVAGFMMIVCTCLHRRQFSKMFVNMRQRLRWFWRDTMAVIIFTALTFITGLVKLVSPVKIPHLGLWHYALGIAMTVFIAIHLIRGIPSLRRLMRIK